MVDSRMMRCGDLMICCRDDEPPPTLGSVLVASLFSLFFILSEEKLFTLVCSWHLPWAAVVILMLFFSFVGVVLVIVAIALLVMAATKVSILWRQHRGGHRQLGRRRWLG